MRVVVLAGALWALSHSVAWALEPAAPVAQAERCRPPAPDAGASPDTLPTPPGFCMPAFEGRVASLDEARKARMTPAVWREGCPVSLDELAVVHVRHWTPEGETARGEVVVLARVAPDVLRVFETLFNARFPLRRVTPVEAFAGDDLRSMQANNTSAFNCRPVARTRAFSRHSYGLAIDLNPLQNPWVQGTRVSPPQGRAWSDRTRVEPGVVVDSGVAVRAFRSIGWKWGGAWKSAKDYQHFSADGR